MQAKIEKAAAAAEKMMGDLDTQHMRPMQKAAFLCSAKCCDSAASAHELTHCVDDCQQKIQQANHAMQHELADFQMRLQRCAQQCQDMAQESMPSDGSSSSSSGQMKKVQAQFESCIGTCADRQLAAVPKSASRLSSALKGLK